jgi:hypothetical protein
MNVSRSCPSVTLPRADVRHVSALSLFSLSFPLSLSLFLSLFLSLTPHIKSLSGMDPPKANWKASEETRDMIAKYRKWRGKGRIAHIFLVSPNTSSYWYIETLHCVFPWFCIMSIMDRTRRRRRRWPKTRLIYFKKKVVQLSSGVTNYTITLFVIILGPFA